MRSHRSLVHRLAVLALSIALVGSITGVALAHGAGHHPSNHSQPHKGALYISPKGKQGAADRNCASAAYSTVQSAVDAAPSGGTVVVCRGTFTGDVVISKPLTLTGNHGAVIHGAPTSSAICGPLGPCLAAITIQSGHVKVMGLKVTGATGEGILAAGSPTGGSISHVSILNNRVVGNDLGGLTPSSTSPYAECAAHGQVPGDCGEGIHLLSVADSVVGHNVVSGNSGGVLLTDELGPTHGNLITHNTVSNNVYDCGVTMPGHNPNAVNPTTGALQPTQAGVFDNVISHNRITGNGTTGEGSGVLFANALAGTGSYDNLVEFNYIAGNGQSGVTMHAHTVAPGQHEALSGNRIVHNTFGINNTKGDTLDGSQSDLLTTGVLVFSGTVSVHETISHNRFRGDHYGIWLGVNGNATATTSHNVFQHVAVHVSTN
jgi:parallel beta-helix repeat protein